MFTKFHMGESSASHPGISPMTMELFKQGCLTHQNLRGETKPADTPVREKIYTPREEPPAYSNLRPS